MSDAGGLIGLREKQIGVFDDFLSWHPESVESVANPNDNKADENNFGIAKEVAPQVGSDKACLGNSFWFGETSECIEESKESKNRKEENSRKFGQFCQAEENS